MPPIAVTVGSYALPAMAALCLAACRSLWRDAPLLVSDDRSAHSPAIKRVASRHNATFCTSQRRRGHLAGDWQAILNATLWAKSHHATIALKLSQRLIPISPAFVRLIEDPFQDPDVWMVLPGKMLRCAWNNAHWETYCAQPCLGDVVAWRPERVDVTMLEEAYNWVAKERGPDYAYAEVILDRLARTTMKGHCFASHELANPCDPPCYLRKTQATAKDYQAAAERLVVGGNLDLREWRFIEGPSYKCLP